jgi:UMF1 family MFS transporter
MARDLHWKRVLSWAGYDWANSAFATTVMAGFFPVFFKQYWSAGADVTISTYRLGMANSIASILIAALAPVLGAFADQGGARKKFLFFFAAMGVVMTGSLYFVAQGFWPLAVALYALAAIGFSGGNVFYDSLIVAVSRPKNADFVSAFGFAMGYLGGGLLYAVNVLMVLHPGWFHLADEAAAVRVSFLTVAVWWAAFSIPVFLFVPEAPAPVARKGRRAIAAGFTQLRNTFREIRNLRVVLLFLLGYWLYIDGVDTIVRMAVDYGLSLGFDSAGLLTALLITQFVGLPSTLAFGLIGEKLGAKTGILIAIATYIGVTIWGYFMRSRWEFYALAVTIGLVQGGVQALSRSLYSRIIPPDKSAEFFGFYNMLGKFAAIIGPVLMGVAARVSGNPRVGILSLIVLFLSGGILLCFVNEQEGRRRAAALEAV